MSDSGTQSLNCNGPNAAFICSFATQKTGRHAPGPELQQRTGQHSCLEFRRFWIQISVWKLATLIFLSPNQGSSVGIVTALGWMAKALGLDSQQRQDVLLFSTASRLALGPTHPPM
jgi:hypothetical protein